MEEQKKNNPQEKENKQSNAEQEQKPKRHITPAEVDALTGSPTANVRARKHHDTLANTGTNISYEGATPAAGGGSVGTGYGSGQDATGARISTDSNIDHVRTKHEETDKDEKPEAEKNKKGVSDEKFREQDGSVK